MKLATKRWLLAALDDIQKLSDEFANDPRGVADALWEVGFEVEQELASMDGLLPNERSDNEDKASNGDDGDRD